MLQTTQMRRGLVKKIHNIVLTWNILNILIFYIKFNFYFDVIEMLTNETNS